MTKANVQNLKGTRTTCFAEVWSKAGTKPSIVSLIKMSLFIASSKSVATKQIFFDGILPISWRICSLHCCHLKKNLWCERGSVWPDLAIFCLFCNKLKVFGQFLWVLFSIWKNIEPCLAIFYFIGLVNIVRKGQVIKNNLGIWSHWRGYRETDRVERHLVRKLRFVFL